MPPTPARYQALQWFADHEQDPSLVLLSVRPSPQMLFRMVRDGHVVRESVGQFGYERWLLTEQGRELLASRHEPPMAITDKLPSVPAAVDSRPVEKSGRRNP